MKRFPSSVFIMSLAALLLCISSVHAGSLIEWPVNNAPEGSDYVAVAAGYTHKLALKGDGSVVAWGDNSVGQCDVPDPNNYIAISAGNNISVAVAADKSIAAWGDDTYGVVTGVPAGNDFKAVAAGYDHAVALKDDGSLVAWGRNIVGSLSVPTGNDFTAIAAGKYHAIALREDGSIARWGYTSLGLSNAPITGVYTAISAKASQCLATRDDGALVAWGAYSVIPDVNDFDIISAGVNYNIAIQPDLSLYAWGTSPSDMPEGNTFVQVAAGSSSAVAIQELGSLALVTPGLTEQLLSGSTYTIEWISSTPATEVILKYSTDNGTTWQDVCETPVPNAELGQYEWVVPDATSQECLLYIEAAGSPTINAISDDAFTIYECTLSGDVSGDCLVNLEDLAIIASQWLKCGNPFDVNCQ